MGETSLLESGDLSEDCPGRNFAGDDQRTNKREFGPKVAHQDKDKSPLAKRRMDR